jgi:TatD DNase family protein
MLIDTHCHLDAVEFDQDRAWIATKSQQEGVKHIVIPAVSRQNFDAVIALNNQYSHCHYALGIHPMYVDVSLDDDLIQLQTYIKQNQPIAIGEIGLDYFVTKQNVERQTFFFVEQLKLAQINQLPVLLHVRNAIDDVLKYLRRYPVVGGIAHAFNGSFQQATQFIDLGFKLGFGGVVTYSGALKIRELAKKLPLDTIVLETDAPDMPPAWLGRKARNSPLELMKIAQAVAELRGIELSELLSKTSQNASLIFPKTIILST